LFSQKWGWGGLDGFVGDRGDGGEFGLLRDGFVLLGWRGVLGDLRDGVFGVDAELYAGGIFYGDVQGADDQTGAFDVDGVAHEGVDDFHERVLDGLFVFDHRDGVQARLWRAADAALGVLVEVSRIALRGARGSCNGLR
jgi:hypothetical protein